jgi:hypothetical protein
MVKFRTDQNDELIGFSPRRTISRVAPALAFFGFGGLALEALKGATPKVIGGLLLLAVAAVPALIVILGTLGHNYLVLNGKTVRIGPVTMPWSDVERVRVFEVRGGRGIRHIGVVPKANSSVLGNLGRRSSGRLRRYGVVWSVAESALPCSADDVIARMRTYDPSLDVEGA